MSYEIVYAVSDQVAVIMTARPSRLNALGPAVVESITTAFGEAETAQEVRASC